MKNLKKTLALVITFTMLLGCLSGLCLTVGAVEAPDIVRDGLVAWYDGINNSNGTHDKETTVWKDLSGNGRHMKVRLDEGNYWSDNAYHSNNKLNYFHGDLVNLINSTEFTVEYVLGEYAPSPTMNDRMVLFYSDNTELCLCFRNDKPEGEKYVEFKYNDGNSDRPKAYGEVNDMQNVTVAVTFLYTEEEKICRVYYNGEQVAQGVPELMLNTDTFYFNSSDPGRSFEGDIYGFRFYDRALTVDELGTNAASDQLKYRSGNKYDIKKEYDDSDEEDIGGEQITYVNNLVPINTNSNVIDLKDWYGLTCLSEYLYPFESDEVQWEGAKLVYQDDGTGSTPNLTINYRKFCGQNGIDQIDSANAGWVVLKVQIEGALDDINAYGMCGTTYSTSDVGGFSTGSVFGGAECTGEVEYLIYDFAEVFEGTWNYLKLTLEGMTAETVVYLQEVAFFATEEEAFAYAGEEMVPETDAPVETNDPVDDETQAPDDKTDDTQAPDDKPADTKGDDKTDETDAPAEGCASVVGFGAVAVLVAAAAAVVLKKKD